VAALGARAAAGNAGDRIHQRPVAGGNRRANVAYWQILLQKSQNAERLIFRERTKQAAIADRCSLKRAAEVACEFVAGCSGPPHQSSIAAPTARKICVQRRKKTFATVSGVKQTRREYRETDANHPKLTSAADADRRATEAASYDTCLPNIRIPRKVLKGGSHLCAQVVGTARFAVAHL
jgi:hypothetical protein